LIRASSEPLEKAAMDQKLNMSVGIVKKYILQVQSRTKSRPCVPSVQYIASDEGLRICGISLRILQRQRLVCRRAWPFNPSAMAHDNV
jgi:hypothetical protein